MKSLMVRFSPLIVTLMLLPVAASLAQGPSVVPSRSATGLSLEPRDVDLDGRVFYAIAGEDTQVTVTSEASLTRLVATSDRLVGYLATPFDFEESDTPLTAGAFRLPVGSLHTGILERDAELHSSSFLDADSHPEITFLVTGSRDVELVEGGDSLHYRLSLLGELGVKGKAIPVVISAELRYLPDSPRTLYRWPGDLLLLRGHLTVKPTDHGWTPPQPFYADLVADVLEVELFVLLAEISPERTLDPLVSQKAYVDVARFQTRLVDEGDPAGAYAFGRRAMQGFWDDAESLYRIATLALAGSAAKPCSIYCSPPLVGSIPFGRDLEFAEQAAERANELAKGQNPLVLDTLARIAAERGDLGSAVALLERALAIEAPMRPTTMRALQGALETYRALESSRGAKATDDRQP